jgi:Uma2 family endonuclease
MMSMTLLPQSRALTRADLDAMPDDGHRYELIDGSLIVTPAPSRRHQLAVTRLAQLRTNACPAHLVVPAAPTDVALADDTTLQPDVLVVERTNFVDEDSDLRPLVAVEVLSPSTRHIDLSLKKARYEAAGCPSYWVVDPDAPALTAWELHDGQYVELAQVAADEAFVAAARPLSVPVS